MKKIHLLLALLLPAGLLAQAIRHQHGANSSGSVLLEKIKSNSYFFKGDSLNGFPLEATIRAGVAKYPMLSELMPYIRQQEVLFVRKKYGIRPASEELMAAQRTSVPTVLAGSCNNLDFENGNFAAWTGGIGYNANTHNPLVITSAAISSLGVNSPETSCSFHTIVSAGNDPYGGFPMVDPGGGSFACRLGGELLNIGCDFYNASSGVYPFVGPPPPPNITSCTSNDPNTSNTASPNFGEPYSNGETMQQTFLVTTANCLFSYNYAVVISDAPHTGAENPYFSVQVFDQSGALIPCLSYFVEADTTGAGGVPPGFFVSPSLDQLGNSVLYTPWTMNSLNLQPYMGTNVTVKFTSAGCTQGGHFAYAYVDCSCGPLQLIAPSGEVCIGGTETLTGPPNAGGTYAWSGPGIVSGATSQTVTCNQAGTYSVTLTNSKGCAYTIDTTIDFYPKPILAVNGGTVCPGNPVVLNATSTGGAGTLNYTWTPSAGLSVTNDSTTTATVNSTTSYTVTGISAHNCTNSAVAVVTVNSAQPPTFSAPPVCIGVTTSINNTSPAGGTFDWDFGDGSGVVSNQFSPTHTYATTGTFVVTSTVSVGGCIGTNTANVIVNPTPTVTATGTVICSGKGPTTITAGGASTYTWDTGATGSSLTVSPAATTSYTVIGTNANSCTNTAVATVTVLPTPTLTTVGDMICAGFTANISANGANSYSWSGSNIISGNTANSSANPTITSTYTVVGTSATCTASAVVTVTVSPNPTVTVSNQGPFCPGDAVPAESFTTNPNNPATTFQWVNNNPSIGLQAAGGTGSTPAFTCTPNASLAQVQAVVTVTPTLNGCVGAPASFTITVNPTPLASPGPDLEFCPNINTNQINFTCVPVGGAPTFFWTNLNPSIGLGSSGSGNLPGFTTVNTGTTAVTATILVHASLNNCPGPDSVLILTINPNPAAAFVYSSTCLGQKTNFTDESSVGSGSITNWNWDLNNDGVFMDATNPNPNYQFTPAGWHTVGLQVTSNKGCKNQVSEQVYVNPPPTASFMGDVLKGCPVHPVNFTSTSIAVAPSQIVDWSWDFGNGQTSVSQSPTTVLYYNSSPTVPAMYTVSLTVKTDSGCSATITKANYVMVYPQPIAGFDWDPADADVLDPTIHFYNTSVGGSGNLPIKYYLGDVFIGQQDPRNWTNLTNPVHIYNDQEPYTYYVTQWVKNIYGCRDSITHPITIHPAFTFYIPNAFSPNGDGRNEGFKGTGIGIDTTTYNLWVFDRWGNEIFHSLDLEETWNGRVNGVIVQEDVYVWKVRFSDISGTKHEYHGTVSLIK